MLETKTASQAARGGVEQLREATQAAVDSTARTSQEAIGRGKEVFNRTADEARNISSAMVDTAGRGAEVAADVAQRSAEQTRDMALLGMQTAAGVSGRVFDANYDLGQRALASTAHAIETYRQAGESAAEKVQALFATYQQLGRGVQEMQVAYLRVLGRALEQATHRPQDLLRAKSIEEFAQVQRDLYLGAVNFASDASSTLLQMAGRIAQQAVLQPQDQTKIVRP